MSRDNGIDKVYGDLEGGELFLCRGTLCLMSEYADAGCHLTAYIVGSGECFWGGTSNADVRGELPVVDVTLCLESAARHLESAARQRSEISRLNAKLMTAQESLQELILVNAELVTHIRRQQP